MTKSSKKIADSLKSENFFIINNEMLHEFSSILLLKTFLKTNSQTLIIIKKQSIDINKVLKNFIINLVEIKASAIIFTNKKLFYITEIKTKLKLIISQNIKEFTFIS